MDDPIDPEAVLVLGIVAACRTLSGPWADHAWLPVSVLSPAPPVEPWTEIGAEGADRLFYAGPADLTFHVGVTAHYRDNLTGGQPSVWVALQPAEDGTHEAGPVTADPYEGEAWAESPGQIVEAVPMPADVRERLAAFVERFHVERLFEKRRRDRPDPEAMALRPRGRPTETAE